MFGRSLYFRKCYVPVEGYRPVVRVAMHWVQGECLQPLAPSTETLITPQNPVGVEGLLCCLLCAFLALPMVQDLLCCSM